MSKVTAFKTTKRTLADMIVEHEDACNELAEAKAREIALRQEIIQAVSGGKLEEGTNTFTAPADSGLRNTEIKVKVPYYYSVNKEALMAADGVMNQLPVTLQGDGVLFTWKPDLKLGEYRKLHTTHKTLLGRCLTITPGQAALEFKLKK